MFRTPRLLLAGLALAAAPLSAQNGMSHDTTMAMPHDSGMKMMMHDSGMKMDHDKMMMTHDSGMKMMDHGRMTLPHGDFTGANHHKVSGTYQVTEKDGKRYLVLGPDFSLDNAPDPYIVLTGTGMGSGERTLNLGKLKHKNGGSTFEIPGGQELSGYDQVIVWCKKFNVVLGQATLAAAPSMMQN